MKTTLKFLFLSVLLLSTTLLATGPRITPMLVSPDKKEIFALDLPPFISTDIQNSGMLGEIVMSAFNEADEKNIVITTLPLESMIQYYLVEENAMGIMGLHLGLSDNEKETMISIPLFIAQESYIYYKPLHPQGITYKGELSDFSGLTYGAAKGEDATAYEKANIKVKKERTLSLFKKLKSKEVDFICVPKLSAQWFIEKHFTKDKDDFAMIEKNSGFATISIYFNTMNPKSKEISELFKKGLQKIVENGKYGDILRKYINNQAIIDKQLIHIQELLK